MGIWYTTREDVMSSQDIKATAYAARDIDRAVESGARAVEAALHRRLYPWTGTRYFDFPQPAGVPSWRVWFGEHDLISATAITNNDASTVSTASVFFQPQSGPPYEWMELDRGTTASFAAGTTGQRAIAVTGLWGYTNDEVVVGTTAEALDLTETGVDGTTMPLVGVGSILRVDSERMIVTDKTWITTGQTGSLTANLNAQALTVADGTLFAPGETLILDTERVLVVDITANVLSVKRATDGTTLAAHTTATIYAPRALTVSRGALGTTAATHLISASVYEWQPPALAAELNLAYAIDSLLQRQSGYARTIGEGENQREAGGRGIRALEREARSALGRQARTGAV